MEFDLRESQVQYESGLRVLKFYQAVRVRVKMLRPPAEVTSTGHRGVLIARSARIASSDLIITVRGWAIVLERAVWTAHRVL